MAYLSKATTSSGADFLRLFRVCAVNYAVQFRYSLTSNTYFITPDGNYSTQWGNPPYGMAPEELHWGGIFYIGTETDCDKKLDRDLALLARSGFNTLRIVGVAPVYDLTSGGLAYPIVPTTKAVLSEYLTLLTTLLSKMASHGLRAILLIGASGNPWQQPVLYRQFLRDVCYALLDHPAVLAYDLYNEPAWGYPWTSDIDKLATSHWVADSYWTIKSVAPRQLVTIGLTDPSSFFFWDPALIPVDFVSYHFYGNRKAAAADQVNSMLWWAKETSVRPWIIGETGLSGTDTKASSHPMVGSEADQRAYALATLQPSLDCGCDGYSWWQFQEVHWGDDFNDYLGLLTYTNVTDLSNSEHQKLVFSALSSYPGAIPGIPVKPAIYANLDSDPNPELSGTVVDQDGQPVPDATIQGGKRVVLPSVPMTAIVAGVSKIWETGQWIQKPNVTITTLQSLDAAAPVKAGVSAGDLVLVTGVTGLNDGEYKVASAFGLDIVILVSTSGTLTGGSISKVLYPSFSTLSQSNGSFILWTSYPANRLLNPRVSKPGYNTANALSAPNNSVLEAWRDAGWSRRWMASDAGKLNYFSDSGSSLDWTIAPSDKFYVGDFDGDGAEELLCVQTGGAADTMVQLKFDGHWRLVWTNQADPAKGGGIYPYRQQLVVGDFDGDGADEVLGTDVAGNWLTLFKYRTSDWQWVWSNYPAQPDHPLKPYHNKLIAGNFDGSGREFLLGVASWTTLFRFDSTANDWQWVDSDYGTTNDSSHPMSAMRPYAGQLMVGDFDGDGRDEVLGFSGGASNSWATLFGIRGSGSFEWLTSNSGSAEAAVGGIFPYLGKLTVGRFDDPARDRILGISSHSAMFGFDGEDFQRTWSSVRNMFAGLSVASGDRLFPFRPRKEMPGYLLILPSSGTASMVAFDPVLKRQ